MAGRPQRKAPPRRERSNPVQAQRRPILDEAPRTPPVGRAGITRPDTTPLEGRVVAPPIRLSHAYAFALDADVTPKEAQDPDAVVKSLARASAGRNGGRVKLADLVAASMVARTINLIGRDGVAAAKELADRVEGPVVQRTEVASVRYVVSVTPGGSLSTPQDGPLTLSEWEGQVASEGGPPVLLPGEPE